MRLVVQRVTEAAVHIGGVCAGRTGRGLMILIGIEEADTEEDALWLAKKAADMRIFSDEEGKMNLSVKDIGGGALVVSQFTLHASTKKGNRPSFIRAARPDHAVPSMNGSRRNWPHCWKARWRAGNSVRTCRFPWSMTAP